MLSLNVKLICSFLILTFGILSFYLIFKSRKIKEENPTWLYFQLIITSLLVFLLIYSLNQIIKIIPLVINNVKISIYISSFISSLYIFFLILVSILAFFYKKIKLIYYAIELEKIRSDFVAKVSHELRTPLTSIKGATRLVTEEQYNLDERQVKLMEIIKHNTERLIRLIDDLLDLSKIESGKIELVLEPVSLLDITKKSIQSLTPLAEKKHIALSLESFKKPPNMFLDRVRIEQVINNLIENAIKYTPNGGCISINIEDKEKDIICSISDTGIGIPPQDIGKVFTEFRRSSKALLYKGESGTGLGLPITKGIIRAHRGKIWVESTVGKGSNFIFSLPKEKRAIKRKLYSELALH
ncbi:MAG: ATP-binding protein [bacterium]|nr:ATP-binding protein [bacterium]